LRAKLKKKTVRWDEVVAFLFTGLTIDVAGLGQKKIPNPKPSVFDQVRHLPCSTRLPASLQLNALEGHRTLPPNNGSVS